MELRHLRYFLAVADTLHFSRAAHRLHVTQPALSRQIRDLEGELGVALFVRHGNQTTLTPAGTQFAQRARDILSAAERAVREAGAAAQVVRFGHYGTLWADYYGPALRTFAKQHPGVTIEPVEMMPVELLEALRRGELDLALLGAVEPATRRELTVHPLGALPALLAIGAANPLAKRRHLALADLRDAAWIAWDERMLPGRARLLTEAARAAGFTPRITRHVDSVTSVFHHVSTSAAIGYVLPMSKKLPHAGVVFSRLVPPAIAFDLHAVWRRDHLHASRLEKLTELLSAVAPSRT